jgi:acetyl esterase
MKLISVKAIVWIFGALAGLSIVTYIAFQVSPWPSALVIRRTMNGGALMRSLEKHIPPNIAAQLNENYRAGDTDAYLDVFYPSEIKTANRALPAVVWIHGGAWLAGSKQEISGYLKILAGRGYTTIGVDFSLSPGTNYPTQIKQANAALGYITRNAARLHVDPTKVFLAGDSSGAQMAAQLAAIISAPAYAKSVGVSPSVNRSQIRGVILYCGLYDFESMQIAGGIRSSLWSYIGHKNFMKGPELEQMSVARHVTSEFPPMFISVGNSDWLAPQSHLFSEVVGRLGVPVDLLFFPDEYQPRVTHEFQFYLDGDAGRVALERSVKFLDGHLR